MSAKNSMLDFHSHPKARFQPKSFCQIHLIVMGQTNMCSQCQAKEKQKLLCAHKKVSYNRMKRREYEQKKKEFKASRASRVNTPRDDNVHVRVSSEDRGKVKKPRITDLPNIYVESVEDIVKTLDEPMSLVEKAEAPTWVYDFGTEETTTPTESKAPEFDSGSVQWPAIKKDETGPATLWFGGFSDWIDVTAEDFGAVEEDFDFVEIPEPDHKVMKTPLAPKKQMPSFAEVTRRKGRGEAAAVPQDPIILLSQKQKENSHALRNIWFHKYLSKMDSTESMSDEESKTFEDMYIINGKRGSHSKHSRRGIKGGANNGHGRTRTVCAPAKYKQTK